MSCSSIIYSCALTYVASFNHELWSAKDLPLNFFEKKYQ